MPSQSKKVVLITGASSGIGKECALYLEKRGYVVYGTSRKGGGERMLTMDVNDPDSVAAAVELILSKEKRLDVLVNNAGIGYAGSVEDTTLAEARAQMETNYFGVLTVIKAVLPHMRKNQAGKIINISSIGGIISLPFQPHYCASKFALEALSEALRMELAEFSIAVSMVEPGDFQTPFSHNRMMAKEVQSAYREQMKKTLKVMEADERNGPHPILVAKKVESIIRSRRPQLRYTVGAPLQCLAVMLKRYLPGRLFEFLMRVTYKIKVL